MSEHHHHHKRHRDEASVFRDKTLRWIERRKIFLKVLKIVVVGLAIVMAILVLLAYSIG